MTRATKNPTRNITSLTPYWTSQSLSRQPNANPNNQASRICTLLPYPSECALHCHTGPYRNTMMSVLATLIRPHSYRPNPQCSYSTTLLLPDGHPEGTRYLTFPSFQNGAPSHGHPHIDAIHS